MLEGELTFRIGPDLERVSAPAGTFVAVPPNVIHGFDNDGAEGRPLPQLPCAEWRLRRLHARRDARASTASTRPRTVARPAAEATVSPPGEGEQLPRGRPAATGSRLKLPTSAAIEMSFEPGWEGVDPHSHADLRRLLLRPRGHDGVHRTARRPGDVRRRSARGGARLPHPGRRRASPSSTSMLPTRGFIDRLRAARAERGSSRRLREPAPAVLVVEDDGAAAVLQHRVEVAAAGPAPPSTSGRPRATPPARAPRPGGRTCCRERRRSQASHEAPVSARLVSLWERAARAAPGSATTAPPRPPSTPHLRPALARTWRRPSFRRVCELRRPPASTSSSCRPVHSASSTSSSPSAVTGAGSSASFGPSATRNRSRSRGGLTEGQRPPPGASADEPRRRRTTLRTPRLPLRSGRSSARSTSACKRPPQRELVVDRLGKLEAFRDLGREAGVA